MSDKIVYAKAGGPPDNWHGIRVFDHHGSEFHDVCEVHAGEGWLIRVKRNEASDIYAVGDEVATERLEGQFVIVPSLARVP